MCCVLRYPHQALLVVDNLEVNVRTLGKTRRSHTLEMQSSPLMNQKDNLRKDPHQLVMHCRMKAPTPFTSQQKGDAIRSPSYRMQCAQG